MTVPGSYPREMWAFDGTLTVAPVESGFDQYDGNLA